MSKEPARNVRSAKTGTSGCSLFCGVFVFSSLDTEGQTTIFIIFVRGVSLKKTRPSIDTQESTCKSGTDGGN